MKKVRLIARLDIKNEYLIKGIHLEGLRKLGNPNDFSLKYYQQGIDEIIYMDAVASLYGRNSLLPIIKLVSQEVFIPITVGGGLRSIEDVQEVLRAGADKIALNTAAIKDPTIIQKLSNKFGAQCVVLSIEAKKDGENQWEALIDNGREHTGLDVVTWANQAVELGVGEILLTSVDQDGTKRGFDIDLIKAVSSVVSVPVIASGGLGTLEHFSEAVNEGLADAVAVGSALHYQVLTIDDLKSHAGKSGFAVRILN